MGRKRNKNPKQSSDSLSDQVIDLLANILESTGVWKTQQSNDNPWEYLVSCLQALIQLLKKCKAHERTSDEEFDDMMLSLEQATQSVRSSGDMLLETIRNTAPVLASCEELEMICRHQEFARLRPLSCSLVAAVRDQRSTAEDTVERIRQTLSSILVSDTFEEERIDALVLDLDNHSLSIHRRCIDPKKSPWRDAVIFLAQLGEGIDQSQQQPNESPNSEALNENISSWSPEDINEADEAICARSNLMSSTPNVYDVVRAFASQNGLAKRFLSMLIVGAEGSGKTYHCNEIERMVPDGVQGMTSEKAYPRSEETIPAILTFRTLKNSSFYSYSSVPSIRCNEFHCWCR